MLKFIYLFYFQLLQVSDYVTVKYSNNFSIGTRQAWANSVDPDQMLHAASDLDLHYLPLCPAVL